MSDMRYIIENLKAAIDLDEAAPKDFKPNPEEDVVVARSFDGMGGLGSHSPNGLKRDIVRKLEEIADRMRDAEKAAKAGNFEAALREINFLHTHLYQRDVLRTYLETLINYYNGNGEYYDQHFPPDEK